MAASMVQLAICGLFFVCNVVVCFDDEFEGQRTLTLEHTFDQGSNPVYSRRGMVAIRSVKHNKAVFSQNAPLSTEERKALRELALEDGLYRIRIPVKGTGEEDDYVSTFSKACYVYESSLSDTLIVSVDQSGEVLGISMATTTGHCSGIDMPSSNLTDWKTVVDISQTVAGPVPDTQSYIEKIKREEQEKAKGQQGDNRSFFSKYWMYIVPFVVLMMLMNSVDPNQAQGGGGGGR